MKASGSPFGVKIDEKKEHHPIYHLGKIYDVMKLFRLTLIFDYKDFHHFSCKVRVIYHHRPLCKEFSGIRQAIERTLQIV